MVPQSVAFASMIKLACAGLFFSVYVKKAFKIKESVSFTSLAYIAPTDNATVRATMKMSNILLFKIFPPQHYIYEIILA